MAGEPQWQRAMRSLLRRAPRERVSSVPVEEFVFR